MACQIKVLSFSLIHTTAKSATKSSVATAEIAVRLFASDALLIVRLVEP